VSVYDPHIQSGTFPESVEVIQDLSDAKGHDLAVLVTAHQACVDIDWSSLANQMKKPRIYDGRRVLDLPSLKKQGWLCYAVGRPFDN
jgi:UDP-glucose 6-dehydrogenase